MYCNQCGNEIKDGEDFCSNCGKPVKDSNTTNNVNQVNSNNDNNGGIVSNYIRENNITSPMALIAFISSILGFFILPYLFATIAIITAILALQKVNLDKRSKSQAITGIVLGCIDFIGSYFVQGFLIGFLNTYF